MSSDRKLSVVVEGFVPKRSNTLRGFVTIMIPELHLKIFDCAVHEKNASRWVSMPGKAQIDREGMLRKDEKSGKTLYTPTIEFVDPGTRNAFSQKVIKSLLEFAPAAFNEEDAT